MTKQLKIINSDNSFKIMDDKVIICSIPNSSLEMDGKQLYDNLISKLKLTSAIKFIIEIDDAIKDKNDVRICNDIIDVFSRIELQINTKFKLLTEAIDEALDDNSDENDDDVEVEEETDEDPYGDMY